MNLNGKNGWALLLIGCGVLIMLSFFGWGIGYLLHLSFPFILMILGYIGLKNNRKIMGWLLMIIGFAILIGKLSGFITLILAALFIYWGISLLINKPAVN